MSILLFQTNDDGDIAIENNRIKTSGGIETMVYLCLFGGNENHSGFGDNSLQWWGNLLETDDKFKLTSETQNLIRSLPMVTSNLIRLDKAVRRDLQVMIEEKIINELDVTISVVSANRVSILVTADAFGDKIDFKFTVNWESSL